MRQAERTKHQRHQGQQQSPARNLLLATQKTRIFRVSQGQRVEPGERTAKVLRKFGLRDEKIRNKPRAKQAQEAKQDRIAAKARQVPALRAGERLPEPNIQLQEMLRMAP